MSLIGFQDGGIISISEEKLVNAGYDVASVLLAFGYQCTFDGCSGSMADEGGPGGRSPYKVCGPCSGLISLNWRHRAWRMGAALPKSAGKRGRGPQGPHPNRSASPLSN